MTTMRQVKGLVQCAETDCDGGCRFARGEPETGKRGCHRDIKRIVSVVSVVEAGEREPAPAITTGAAGAAPREIETPNDDGWGHPEGKRPKREHARKRDGLE